MKNDDLISRQDAVECVYKALRTPPLKGAFTDTMSLAIGMVNDLPSAQPERKKGRWILSDEQRQEDVDNGNYRFVCSECGKSDIHSEAVTVSFCWNCGAEMRDEDDNIPMEYFENGGI